MTAIDALLSRVTVQLAAAGASAVVLVGSHARGSATPFSDIDLYAIGVGPEYNLRREDGSLVSVSWRTPAAVREEFLAPREAMLAVPAWRRARILRDDDGEAHELQREAVLWTWDFADDPDTWCATELSGYGEEVQKLRWAVESGNETSAAIWRNVVAMRMAGMLAVHHRFLLDREEDIWPAVAERMGEPWASTQTAALAIDSGFRESCQAALNLVRMTMDVLAPSMTDEQLAVIAGALA